MRLVTVVTESCPMKLITLTSESSFVKVSEIYVSFEEAIQETCVTSFDFVGYGGELRQVLRLSCEEETDFDRAKLQFSAQ